MVTAIPDPVSFQDFVEKFMDGEGMKSFFPFLNSFKVNATRQMTSLGIIFAFCSGLLSFLVLNLNTDVLETLELRTSIIFPDENGKVQNLDIRVQCLQVGI